MTMGHGAFLSAVSVDYHKIPSKQRIGAHLPRNLQAEEQAPGALGLAHLSRPKQRMPTQKGDANRVDADRCFLAAENHTKLLNFVQGVCVV